MWVREALSITMDTNDFFSKMVTASKRLSRRQRKVQKRNPREFDVKKNQPKIKLGESDSDVEEESEEISGSAEDNDRHSENQSLRK